MTSFDSDNNSIERNGETDFDDATDSTVTAPTASQASANDNIKVAIPASDAAVYIVKFVTPAEDKLVAANYGLNQGANYLVATKQSDDKWTLGVVTEDSFEFNFVGSTTEGKRGLTKGSGVAMPNIATIDENTGEITLVKKFVKGQSSIEAKAQDAYGNIIAMDTDSNTAGDQGFNVKHKDPAEADIFVRPPVITRAGEFIDASGNKKGLIDVAPGPITWKQGISDTNDSGQERPEESNFITTVTANGKTFTITYVPATKNANPTDQDEEDGNNATGFFPEKYVLSVTEDQYAAYGIQKFNSETGVVTLFGDDKTKVTAKAQKNVKDKTETFYSDPVEETFYVVPPEEDKHADQATVSAQVDGSMWIKPGDDNVKVVVEYYKKLSDQDKDGTKVSATLTKVNGTWTATGENASDFEINKNNNGKIELKASAVKDGMAVTTTGYDDAMPKANQAEPYTDYALVDDDSIRNADSPQNTPVQNDYTEDFVVEPGADNIRMKVTYTKPDGTKETLFSQLDKDGKWKLTDEQGNSVPDYRATVNPENGAVSLKPSEVQRGGDKTNPTVTATGYNSNGRGADTKFGTSDKAPAPKGDKYKVTSLSDGSFTIEPTDQAPNKNQYAFKFKVYDTNDQQVKDMIVVVTKNGYKIPIPTVNGQTITTQGEIGIADPDPNGNALTISSGSRYRLIADSPSEPAITDKQAENLKLYIFDNATVNYGDTANNADADQTTFLINTVISELPTAEMPELQPITTGDNIGGVIIMPKATNDRLVIDYVKENGTTAKATLVKRDGNWVVEQGDANDFILNGAANPIIKPDALFDLKTDGVKVKGGQSGHKDSAEAKATPPKDYDPANEFFGGGSLINILGDSARNEDLAKRLLPKDGNDFLSDDIIWRWGYREDAYRSTAFKKLVEDIQNANGKLGTFSKEQGKPVGAKFDYTDEQNVLYVNGSIGDTSGYGLLKFAARPIEMNFKGGNDLLLVGNDIGEDDPKKSITEINMGDGHDMISVGTNNTYFELYENDSKHNTADRFRYYNTGNAGNAAGEGYRKVSALETRFTYNQGGRIIEADIDAGKGNDLLVVEGKMIGDFWLEQYAIDKSRINMGEDNDALIIAENGIDRAWSDPKRVRGQIRDSQIDMGSGDDYIKVNAVVGNTEIKLGDGNDNAEVMSLIGSRVRLDTGSGNDSVTITSEIREGATVSTGSGDDTLTFRPLQKITSIGLMYGARGKEDLFEGYFDGGEGKDRIILGATKTTEAETAITNKMYTNLHVKQLRSVEEIWMEKGTAVDVEYYDLLNDGTNGPIKIRATGDIGDRNSKYDARVVDIGGGQNNDYGYRSGSKNDQADLTERRNAGQTENQWVKAADNISEDGVEYRVYTYRGDSSNAIWVDTRIDVI